MSYELGPVATLDNYDTTTTREVSIPCYRITGWVSNAPVYYKLLNRDGHWTGEKYLPAASGQSYFFTFSRLLYGVKFRSAVAGTPATVVIDLLTAEDLPPS